MVNLDSTGPSLFEYPAGKSSADFVAPEGYEPQFAGFENLSYEELLEIDSICGDDQVHANAVFVNDILDATLHSTEVSLIQQLCIHVY